MRNAAFPLQHRMRCTTVGVDRTSIHSSSITTYPALTVMVDGAYHSYLGQRHGALCTSCQFIVGPTQDSLLPNKMDLDFWLMMSLCEWYLFCSFLKSPQFCLQTTKNDCILYPSSITPCVWRGLWWALPVPSPSRLPSSWVSQKTSFVVFATFDPCFQSGRCGCVTHVRRVPLSLPR